MNLDLSITELLNILKWYKYEEITNKRNINDVKSDMNYEIFMLEQISKQLKIPVSHFFYCGDNRMEVLTHFWNLCKLRNIVPSYQAQLEWQKMGADYIVNGVLLDLKVVYKNYGNRASFNLIKDEKSGLWRFPNEMGNRVIAPYLTGNNTQYLFPVMLITDIVNRNIEGLPFDISNYNNQSLFNYRFKNNRDLFNIDCECIQKCVKPYLDKKSNYNYVTMLLGNYSPIKVDKKELDEYLNSIDF